MEGASSSSAAGNGGDYRVSWLDAQGGEASMLVDKVAKMIDSHRAIEHLFVDSPDAFTVLCTSIANAIDDAIANNDVPGRYHRLAQLLIQVYEARANNGYKIGLFMLTVSVQCACQLQWFTNEDTEALLEACKEVMNHFTDSENVQIGPRDAISWLSEVISRYYPSAKIEHVMFSALIKPGCQFCVAGIPKINTTVSPGRDKISLFAIQVDNLEKSPCTFIPLGVYIKIDSNDIKGNTTLLEEERRQLPVDVTALLKPGVNWLQVSGNFECTLLVAIVVTSGTEPCVGASGSKMPVSSISPNSGQTPQNQTGDLLYSGLSTSRVPNPDNHFPFGVDHLSDIAPTDPNPLEAEGYHRVQPDDSASS